MAQELPGQTLQPTALVHEAYLRLVGNHDQKWNGRGHFFGAAAEAMRRILPWFDIATNTAPASGLIEYHETTPPPCQAFYRALQP